ncbi:MAG: M14 family zinc carboxypeptidase [Litorilituus sp.]|nr:M14 family zinc carboxypeptidase [Litorilituus sp.]
MFAVHRLISLFLLLISLSAQALPVNGYLPKKINYDPSISRPSTSLGFEIGQRHIRHDQLIKYFSTLAKQSSRLQLTTIGKTAQQRDQFLVTISSPDNLAKLDNILNKRHIPLNHTHPQDEPLVIWLGYSIHGDEISGANAAMVVAYYLAASQEESIETILANTIIVLEPSMNPDGMDRFVNWVSTFRGSADNSDANHIEHHQDWVSGRTNHFWFDLNRDWLLLTQSESRHRLRYFHHYQPHVLGDYHEMGPNSSYFFQPGIISRTNPLTPKKNVSLTQALAKYHAKALDGAQRLYYSEESFDDFYYGKGSTYPDINGGIGILFEQASSRGMQQKTINGLLTFEYGIQNHVLTSLSTIEGAWHNREALKQYRHEFYQQSIKQAKKDNIEGYLVSEAKDKFRLHALLSTLSQHQIKVYPLTKDFAYNDNNYAKADSYFIPTEQAQYRLIQALFTQATDFPDNTFYDVSGWTIPLAMNIGFQALDSTWGIEHAKKAWSKADIISIENTVSEQESYAYAFEWHHYLAPKLLNQLLARDIKAKVATSAFISQVANKDYTFKAGTIIVPAAIQTQLHWRKTLITLANQVNLPVKPLNSGLTSSGIDLGSSSFHKVTPPKALLLGGEGVSQYEAGEVRYYLDETLAIPVSIVDHKHLDKLNLSHYSHVILVNGNYTKVSDKSKNKLKDWLQQGGVIIGQKRGAKWLSQQEILAVDFVSKEQIDQLFDSSTLTYLEKEKLAARKRIAGAIFNTQLDISHPLAFGFDTNTLPLFRNSTLIMKAGQQPFITLAKYTPKPLLSGYSDKNLVNQLAHHAAIVAHNVGTGRVIATTDVLAFRGYWLGSSKLLANSLFFAKAFNTPIGD